MVVTILKENLAGIQVDESDVIHAYRLGKATVPPANPAAIVVQFRHRLTRNHIFKNKKLLKGKKIALTEHLTSARSQLLKRVMNL